MSQIGLWCACLCAGTVMSGAMSPSSAAGLGGVIVNGIAPGLGLGDRLDDANRGLKNTIPGYNALDEGASTIGRAAGNSVAQIGGDVIKTTVKAGGDVVVTVQNAGKDVAATYEKGWRDTTAQAQRSFVDVVDAGQAVVRFTGRQYQDQIKTINNAARRAREGKVVDAVWGLAVEPAQASERNFAKATQESAVINATAQMAATAYGGPGGAAAYAAWYTYRATGDVNLALKAGVLSAATSAAGGSVANMPSGTALEVLKKAAVAGAVGGIAVAAAGGDEQAVKDAFLKSGGAVLVQGASARLNAYSPRAHDALQAMQCISARDIDCLSNTTYAKDVKGHILYDRNGRPRIDTARLDPSQYIGRWSGIDPNSLEGKNRALIAGISKIPQTQSIPLAHSRWVVTWTLGQNQVLQHNTPAVVLTYVGDAHPFYSRVTYRTAPRK